MAEAHAAVAFQFTVTPEGQLSLNVDKQILKAVWLSGVHDWEKRFHRMSNQVLNGVYPASPATWVLTIVVVCILFTLGVDASFGWVQSLSEKAPGISTFEPPISDFISILIFGTLMWLVGAFSFRLFLRWLLAQHFWMYEPVGKPSIKTRLFFMAVKILCLNKANLLGFQYLKSVRHLMTAEKFTRMKGLVDEFKNTIGPKLQRYLVLKSWWSSNYVSDWWEEFIYLYGRSPIMVNSNYYGMILVNKTIPLCSWQYERQFNTTRIPGVEVDTLYHVWDSRHVVVYHKGKYFKLFVRVAGRYLTPCELEISLRHIVEDKSEPAHGEQMLAALTAGERVPWAEARHEYFSTGVNKTSLDAIENAAFFVTLDDEAHNYSDEDPEAWDRMAKSLLHGNVYDRWFDKSFNLIVFANGKIGLNAEHSCADAPIMAHLYEYCLPGHTDCYEKYNPDGSCKGEPRLVPPHPTRLHWDIPKKCMDVIEQSYSVGRQLADDVDMNVFPFRDYGKGFVKTCKISPDAWIQMALQLAYYKDMGNFTLTYEAAMTRLFREGRTETVRSCSKESSDFVLEMVNPNRNNKEAIRLLGIATDNHLNLCKDAMCSKGIDRHLFCLYVVSKYLKMESQFLQEVLREPWHLSTSQTPAQQTARADFKKHPENIGAGGGFGPVSDDGYGVSYIITGEDIINFHISSKRSCPLTDSHRFGRQIRQALLDMRQVHIK